MTGWNVTGPRHDTRRATGTLHGRMSRIDTLAVDHRAVLLLVLREGHSYGALADRLGIPEDAGRGRAHAALDALGADVSPARDAARRALLADHLLGRHDESGRVAARRLLDEDAAARAWACAVAAPLREIGGDRVPEIPSAASPARARTGARRPAIPLVIAGVAAAAVAVV